MEVSAVTIPNAIGDALVNLVTAILAWLLGRSQRPPNVQ